MFPSSPRQLGAGKTPPVASTPGPVAPGWSMLGCTTAEQILSGRLSGKFWVTPLSALESAQPASLDSCARCAEMWCVARRLSKLTFSAKPHSIASQSFKCYCLASQTKCFCRTPNMRKRVRYFSSWVNSWIYLRISFWGGHCKDPCTLVEQGNFSPSRWVPAHQNSRGYWNPFVLWECQSWQEGHLNIQSPIQRTQYYFTYKDTNPKDEGKNIYRGKNWASEAEFI